MDEQIQQRLEARQYDRAFELLLLSYQDRVFRLCCAMLGKRSTAEETAQDAFVRIWKALPKFRGDSSLSTWIYAVTRNTCLTVRSREKSPLLSLELPGVRLAAERSAAGSRSPDHGPDVLRVVAELPEHYRQVVLLFHMEDRSYEEVAKMLDLPLGTVKTYLHRARKQMAEALAEANESTMADRKS